MTEQRSVLRGDTDTPARLAAWDATEADVLAHPSVGWDLRLRTDRQSIEESAQVISEALKPADEPAF
ncbi:hypothetical protein ACFQ2M_22360 [Kitasatospora saccharophila]|uniref:hypothetical protein n=1 Tax=Kitasatospora saccharophila TaxID=407973 RepID=UPI00362F7420